MNSQSSLGKNAFTNKNKNSKKNIKRVVKQTNLNNSLKRNKQSITPMEYLHLNSPQMFAKNMFSQNKVISMNQDNLVKYRSDKQKAALTKDSYHLLVSSLIEKDILDKITHKNIIDKMLQVDRKYYCDESEEYCYSDTPSVIVSKQTISALHMYAYACSLLQPNLIPGAHVLDVGSGSGMLTVIFANMVNSRGDLNTKQGKVVGVDILDEMVTLSKKNIDKDTVNRDLVLDEKQEHFKIIKGNGKLGYPEKSKDRLYDVIHVGATNHESYAPAYLKYQLKEGGLMFLPMKVDEDKQIVRLYQRKNGKIRFTNTEITVKYVKLVDKQSEITNTNE